MTHDSLGIDLEDSSPAAFALFVAMFNSRRGRVTRSLHVAYANGRNNRDLASFRPQGPQYAVCASNHGKPKLAGETGFNFGVDGRRHGGIDEMWMQSEPRWPRIILAYIRQREVKRAPQVAIPPGRRPSTIPALNLYARYFVAFSYIA